jgi:hypothetical protein
MSCDAIHQGGKQQGCYDGLDHPEEDLTQKLEGSGYPGKIISKFCPGNQSKQNPDCEGFFSPGKQGKSDNRQDSARCQQCVADGQQIKNFQKGEQCSDRQGSDHQPRNPMKGIGLFQFIFQGINFSKG